MESFDVDLALRLALDSKKAEESDSMVLYVRNLGVVKKLFSTEDVNSCKAMKEKLTLKPMMVDMLSLIIKVRDTCTTIAL